MLPDTRRKTRPRSYESVSARLQGDLYEFPGAGAQLLSTWIAL